MAHLEREKQTLDRVLEALERETGLHTRVLQWEPRLDFNHPNPVRPDAMIEVGDHQRIYPFTAEIKFNLDRFEVLHRLQALQARVRHTAQAPLLVATPFITPQLAERFREMDICYADIAGNAYLKAPGLHVHVAGKKRPLEIMKADEGRAATPTGLRVVFALLCQPALLNANYREIAAAARVALGTVVQVIKDLENRRYITPITAKRPTLQRRMLDPERLLQEWVAAYPTALRPKLNARRFQATNPTWTEGVNLAPYGAFWGGEVAANRLTHYLQPQTAIVYAKEAQKRLIIDQRLRADVHGDTEILDVFWNTERLTEIRDVVPPILVYADLVTTADGRNMEVAKVIYDEFIDPLLRNRP